MEEKEKQSFINWVKEHKDELIIASGISIVVIIGIIFGIKNRSVLMRMWTELKDAISKNVGVNEKTLGEETVPIQVEEIKGIVEMVKPLRPVVEEDVNTEKILIEVPKHIRNLHSGCNPSPEKVATATKNGFKLLPGQTWVDSYTKGMTVAA